MRLLLLLSLAGLVSPLAAVTFEVNDPAELTAALAKLSDGDVVKIAPGEYGGGHTVRGIADLTIQSSDSRDRPHFSGGKEAWHFSRCHGLTLRNLRCSGQSENGINIDDGGEVDSPVVGVRVENVLVRDVGPIGNFDAIKCSGLDDLKIRDCQISGWGGQAIDLVGCHKVLITGCTITGKRGFSQHTGPQFKGGCEDVTIEKCVFKGAGERPIQAGGSTGMDFFRPPGVKYEAHRIIIRDNFIWGGVCACAFTGVDGAVFESNIVLFPEKWIFRFLQENKEPGFRSCGNVKVSGNVFLFRRAKVRDEINLGPGIQPETLSFEGNGWHAVDRWKDSKPNLPVEEKGGRYGPLPR